jgi:hypothetical protein
MRHRCGVARPTHTVHTPAGLGFDVFQPITPVILGIGSYEVDAVGFSSTELNGNRSSCSIGPGCPSLVSSSGPVLNDGGGLPTFTGASFDASAVLDDPLTCTTYPCLPPSAGLSQFDAGTFEFSATARCSRCGLLRCRRLCWSRTVQVALTRSSGQTARHDRQDTGIHHGTRRGLEDETGV